MGLVAQHSQGLTLIATGEQREQFWKLYPGRSGLLLSDPGDLGI